jgi:putative ABC transport system ATP-binding protein
MFNITFHKNNGQQKQDQKNGCSTPNLHPLITLHQVSKIYQTAAGPFTALNDINIQIKAGEFVAVTGKSGSGKSTLINMITGIDRPTTGEVWVNEVAVHTLSEGQMAKWRGRYLGIIFQFFQLLPTLTVLENIMLPMDFCRLYSARQRKERALQLLAQVEMADHAHKLPSALSGGQQQRVAIARALSNDPPILVADEPTGNLDSRTAAAVFHLFEKLVAEGKTILMVTHDNDLARRVHRIITVVDGAVVDEKRVGPEMTQRQPEILLANHCPMSIPQPEVSYV